MMSFFREEVSSSYFNPFLSDKFFFVHGFRTLVHCLLFLGFMVYQFTQPLFLNADVWVIAYLLLFTALLLDFLGFYFYENIKKSHFIQNVFFALDPVLVTIGFYVMSLPALSSLLMYVYFFQIISAGFIGKYKTAFTQCLLTSLLFTWILILKPSEMTGASGVLLVFSIGSLLFILAAGVGGFVGVQANRMNWSLKKVSKDLSQLRNINQLIVQNIDMGLLITDEEDTIVYANQQALRILNLPSHSLESIGEIFPHIKPLLHSEKQQKKELHSRRVLYQKNDGDLKTIELFVSPFWDQGTHCNKHLILFQDFTLEEQRNKKEQEEKKFIFMGQMAQGIAQALKKPLSQIDSSIRKDGFPKSRSESQDFTNGIKKEINRLNSIIGDFLSFTQNESETVPLPLEGIQVNAILEDLLAQVSQSKKWSHIHHFVTLKAHGFIEGHQGFLKQAFFHILQNSCESMENQQKNANLSVETFDDSEWVVIRIKDAGSGIDERDRPYIFEPFYSTKSNSSGLGLAIAYKRITQYRGSISFESSNTGGTICTLRFPNQPTLLPGEAAKPHKRSA